MPPHRISSSFPDFPDFLPAWTPYCYHTKNDGHCPSTSSLETGPFFPRKCPPSGAVPAILQSPPHMPEGFPSLPYLFPSAPGISESEAVLPEIQLPQSLPWKIRLSVLLPPEKSPVRPAIMFHTRWHWLSEMLPEIQWKIT